MIRKTSTIGILLISAMILFSYTAWAEEPMTTRIKDIARLQGVRSNQISGMGLVVGLSGTGDSSKVNAQMVANTLLKWNINVNVADLKVKNIAAVIITANLPPYVHQGDTLDVQVSSIGDSKSLQGGILLQSPLTGADGKVYAVAQGPVYLGGYSAGGKGASQQKNITTVGIVNNGAIVEREVPMQFTENGKLKWVLNRPDFTTASRLAKTINDNVASETAIAVDMGAVEVKIPSDKKDNMVSFIAEIETLPVTPDGIAKVIINERTGTIVVGGNVKIAPVAVSHGNITVKVNEKTSVSQPAPLSNGTTTKVKDQNVQVEEQAGSLVLLPAGSNIGSIVKALNAVGSTPQDITAILMAIKDAGALYGVLEFQ